MKNKKAHPLNQSNRTTSGVTMNFRLFLLPLLFFISFHAQCQTTHINIGTVHKIESHLLKSHRFLSVYLPKNYHQSDKSYPVLYILDGQWYFSNGVAIQQSLRVPDRLPEMIVVGINSDDSLRNTLLYGKRQQFLAFIEKEVLTYIETHFRTNNERLLFGWEAAAFFGNYVLLTQPDLFNAVIISNGADPDESLIDEFNATVPQKTPYLYIANSRKDIYSIQYSDDFVKHLKRTNPAHLKWHYQLFNNEEHESLPYLALYHGLNYYYHNYSSLVFASIDEFNTLGGMEYLRDYFKDRSHRFGFVNAIDDGTKNSLIWLAWNRNDFKSFQLFMHEFKDVLNTKRYDSAYWHNRFGQFYLKHKAYDKAIHFFNIGITQYPKASQQELMHSGLAEAYFGKGDNIEAISLMKKAIELANNHSSGHSNDYLQRLAEFEKVSKE